jgi:hypothetical protein
MTIRVLAFLLCVVAAPGAFADACSGGNLVPQTDLCLAGTTMIGNGGVAVFKNKSKSLSVEAGDTVAGWRVSQVKPGAVIITRDGISRQLVMNRISTAARLVPKRPATRELHDISPVAAGKVASVGTTGPDGKRLSISTHLPPVQDY